MGRSGTTILYELFVKHKDTAYFEHYSNKFYKSPKKFPSISLNEQNILKIVDHFI